MRSEFIAMKARISADLYAAPLSLVSEKSPSSQMNLRQSASLQG